MCCSSPDSPCPVLQVLDFLLDQLPEIEVPPIEGVKDKMCAARVS